MGKKGDVVALEVNMRPCGGFSPDMMNYANSTNVYKIWADMIAFDRSTLETGEHAFCAYAGRRDGNDDAADGIGAETDGHHPLVYFDALGEARRYVVQVERLPGPLLRHAVDEDLDVLAAEPVEHQLHVGAYAARFAELHAGQFRESVAQALGRVLQGFRIYRHRVERRLLHAAYAAARDNDLFESGRCRLQDDREVFHVPADFYVFLGGPVADKRYGERMLSGRHLETEPPPIVRGAAVVRAFQTDGGESDCRAVFLHHLSREPCGGVRAVMSGMRTKGLGCGRLKAEGQHDRQ